MNNPRVWIKSISAMVILAGFSPIAQAEFSTSNGADLVLGQDTFGNRYPDAADKHTAADSLYYPKGVTACGDWMFVADSYNRRVVGYRKLGPDNFAKTAQLVLGKNDLTSNNYASNQPVSAATMNYPSGIQCDGTDLYVVDSNYHRILIFKNVAHLPIGT